MVFWDDVAVWWDAVWNRSARGGGGLMARGSSAYLGVGVLEMECVMMIRGG
jgi:hypothetical protein